MPVATTGDLATRYEDRGQGRPIVLVHASLMDHRCWRGQAELLGSSHRVVSYDLRGHGETPNPGGRGYTVDTLARDLGALIDALKLEKPVVCGWSLGGMVALTYASRNPRSISGLVVAGAPTPPLLTFAERLQRVVVPRLLLGPARLVGYARIKRALIRIQGRVHGEEAMGSFSASDLPDMATRDFVHSVRCFAGFHRMRVDLASLRFPTLVLHGENEPPFIARHARRIHESAPHARVVPIPRAGHAIHIDEPARFHEELASFLGAIGDAPRP